MIDLIATIDEIVKYGLCPNLEAENRDALLQKNLVGVYYFSFGINDEFDETEFPDFDKSELPNIQQNIKSNFPYLGFYTTVLDINDIDAKENTGIGDATDDLLDIILDLLEVKWRVENNSWANGLCHFKFIFHSHTQKHLLNLLNYMKQKTDS